jgi:DNA-binding NarL/FixJ family response regulator
MRLGCERDGVPLRCLIVDDSSWFLAAARVLLEREGLPVVGVASTGAEALRRVQELRVDVVLVDLVLGAESGFDVIRRIAEAGEDDAPTTILISTYGAGDVVDLMPASPAAGFLQKSDLSADAVRRIVEGGGRAGSRIG